MVRFDWDDPTKQLGRDLEQLGILEFFTDPTKRGKLQVVHLPGGSDLEYQRVFKSVGISPSGIVGVEENDEVFNFLDKKKQKGEIPYELYHGTLEEYLATTRRKFDGIFADTTRNFGPQQANMIWDIFQRPVLKDRGILHTVFLAKRDKAIQKVLYATWVLSKNMLADSYQPNYQGTLKAELRLMLERMQKLQQPKVELKQMRDIGITEFITYCAKIGRHISPTFQSTIKKLMSELHGKFFFDTKECIKILGEDLTHKLLYNLCCASYNFSRTNDMLKHGLPAELVSYVMLEQRRPWFIQKLKKYEYVGEKGSLMYGDLLELDRRNDLMDNPRYKMRLEDFLTGHGRERKTFPLKTWERNLKYTRNVLQEINSLYTPTTTHRIRLSL